MFLKWNDRRDAIEKENREKNALCHEEFFLFVKIIMKLQATRTGIKTIKLVDRKNTEVHSA